MRGRILESIAVAFLATAVLASCRAAPSTQVQGPPTTAQVVNPAPETSVPATLSPSVSQTTNPPHTTRPPRTTRPPTPTRTSTSTTAPTPPQLLSLTFSYKGFDLTDVVFTDHNVPPCAHTVWPLKMLITPGDIPFRLVIRLNGVVAVDSEIPPWQPPEPDTVFRPVSVDGPHDVSAEVRLVFTGGSTARFVHFGCKAP